MCDASVHGSTCDRAQAPAAHFCSVTLSPCSFVETSGSAAISGVAQVIAGSRCSSPAFRGYPACLQRMPLVMTDRQDAVDGGHGRPFPDCTHERRRAASPGKSVLRQRPRRSRETYRASWRLMHALAVHARMTGMLSACATTSVARLSKGRYRFWRSIVISWVSGVGRRAAVSIDQLCRLNGVFQASLPTFSDATGVPLRVWTIE